MLQVREGYLYVMYVMYLPDADGKIHVCVSCIKKLQLAESDYCTLSIIIIITFWYFLKLPMLEMEGQR